MRKNIVKGFKNPNSVYRSAPFWSWNDELEVKELCFQLDKMKEGGFGGGFMHSRVGLVTSYMSEKWMRCVKETVKYAEKIGLKAYLYDEDRWPSGFAGGVVTKKKSNRIKFLKVYKEGNKWKHNVCIGENTEWFNGAPYVDTLSEETVGDFLESTYEVYKKRLKKYFGKAIPAIFTDEPNYFSHPPCSLNEKVYCFPWTKNFEKIFKKKYGYDIFKNVEALVKEISGFEKIRYQYYRLITELFVKNFGKKIYDWCEKNNIPLTGHYLAEDTLERQIGVAGDAMALYEYMQWPGVDHLSRNIKFPLTLKQCSSVAHQLGKERVLSELYGCSGQNFTLADRKWIGDWHLALGINFFCPHLYLYSLRGCRKRDYPPTISHHQPYWKHSKPLEDYFARLNFLLSQGRFKANVLVIHPVESGWCTKGSKKIEELDESLAQITQSFLENKIEYDFGNEQIMEKYCKVKNNKLEIGQMDYECVVIPPSITLRKKTVSLLNNFCKKGGKVFADKKFPYLTEGKPAGSELFELKEKTLFYKSIRHLIKLLAEKRIQSEFEIVESSNGKEIPEIFIHRRILDSTTSMVFLTNTSSRKSFTAEFKVKYTGMVWKANGFTGGIEPFGVKKEKSGMKMILDFPPVSSHLFVIDSGKKPFVSQEKKIKSIKEESIKDWKLAVDSLNVLVLDFCKYKKGKMKNWSKKLPVLKIQRIFEKENKKQPVELLFDFKVDEDFDEKKLSLVVEEAKRFEIKLNGKKIPSKSAGKWLDKCFTVIDLPEGFVKKGKNVLVLKTLFIPPKKKGTLIFKRDGIELESIYITGDFALTVEKIQKKAGGYFHKGFSLSNTESIKEKDLNIQGYPFYSGSLISEREIKIEKKGREKYFLEFEKFSCVSASVKINGKFAGLVYLPPYNLEITGFLKKGKNKISIKFVSSLRNLLGPHHMKEHNSEAVGPGSFNLMETDSYSTLPFGCGEIKLKTKTPK